MELPRLMTRTQLALLLGISRDHSLVKNASPVAELFLGGAVVPLFQVPVATNLEQKES